MIVVISATGSNIRSVSNALQRLEQPFIISNDKTEILNASRVILPGVGTARMGMNNLIDCGLVDVIKNITVPVLGICLGMQLLYEYSHESNIAGIGVIPGEIQALSLPNDLVRPHMGWNKLIWQSDTPLNTEVISEPYVYFVHGYAAMVDQHTLASCNYGGEFSAMVNKENFYGMQFHPEKSSMIGMQLLKNFCEAV